MDTTAIVGYFAALCSTTSFAPQAWKIIKSRDTSAISATMYLLTVIGFAAWFAFGILRDEWPIILPNGICFLLAGFILVMKLLPGKHKNALADSLDTDDA